MRVGRLLLAALLLSALCAAPAAGQAAGQTSLISRTADGATADGPSQAAVISQDRRFARVVAFQSSAGNLAPGTAPGVTNIFLAHRAPPFGENGDRWVHGGITLATKGSDGQPANGDSHGAALSGTSRAAAPCVAFVSAASNLVEGDTNGQPDAFVQDLTSGVVTRVSTSSGGRQANGPTDQVAVDGLCTRVAFTSRATNLGLKKTRRESWRPARTRHAPPGVQQVYVKFLGDRTAHDRALKGLTMLASAHAGRPGDGPSSDPDFSQRGRALVFTSQADNLGAGASEHPQIHLRGLRPALGRKVRGRSVRTLSLTATLVSGPRPGEPGNGPSVDPAIDAAGTTVAYETRASNLRAGDLRDTTQIVRTSLAGDPREHTWISNDQHGRLGSAPSHRAAITAGGTSVFFDTAARNLRPPGDDVPARQVVFTRPVPFVVSTAPQGGPMPQDAIRADPSAHLNYVVFESAGSVWLRYLGPK